MIEAHSTTARAALLLVMSAVVVQSVGCSSSHPVVVNSTEPWEDELLRERQAAQRTEESSPQASVAPQMYGSQEENEKEPKHNALVVAITDIVAFPFRGAGWVAQQIF
jgi:hypothetical protein